MKQSGYLVRAIITAILTTLFGIMLIMSTRRLGIFPFYISVGMSIVGYFMSHYYYIKYMMFNDYPDFIDPPEKINYNTEEEFVPE